MNYVLVNTHFCGSLCLLKLLYFTSRLFFFCFHEDESRNNIFIYKPEDVYFILSDLSWSRCSSPGRNWFPTEPVVWHRWNYLSKVVMVLKQVDWSQAASRVRLLSTETPLPPLPHNLLSWRRWQLSQRYNTTTFWTAGCDRRWERKP